MSDILRCDRCRIELPVRLVKKRKFFADIEETENYYGYHGTHLTANYKDFHLCNDCRESFIIWLGKGK